MASVDSSRVPSSSSPTFSTGPSLKYLGFFRVAVLQVYVMLLQFYDQLKLKSGSLKPAIENVESSVKSVLSPVASKVNFDPDQYLKIVDLKVDETLKYADKHTPEPWKSKALEAYEALSKLPSQTHGVVAEYKSKGAVATLKTYVDYFVPIVVSYISALWSFILTLPMVPQIVATALPYAIYWAQHFNHVVAVGKKSDVSFVKSVAEVVPLIPVEKLKKSD